MTIKRAAAWLHLTWDQVKDLDKRYTQAQRLKAPTPGSLAIGIDEVSP